MSPESQYMDVVTEGKTSDYGLRSTSGEERSLSSGKGFSLSCFLNAAVCTHALNGFVSHMHFQWNFHEISKYIVPR